MKISVFMRPVMLTFVLVTAATAAAADDAASGKPSAPTNKLTLAYYAFPRVRAAWTSI